MNENGVASDLWNSTYHLLTNSAFWLEIALILVKIIVIFIIARIVIAMLKRFITKLFASKVSERNGLSNERKNTLTSLLNNLTSHIVFFIAILIIFSELGFPIGPILAGAGVVGLAIGFGSQQIVKDVITGFFIIYEDQYSVGDFISTSGYTGRVQDIGLRATKIKEWTGQIHFIPNGDIAQVTNFSKENSMAVLDIGVSYDEKISQVEQVLIELLNEVYAQEEDMIEQPTIIGVQDLADSDVVLRVAALCKPVTHWAIARKLRRHIKDRFDERGIEIPYPQMVTYRREEQ